MSRLRFMRIAQPVMARFPGASYRLASVAGWVVWNTRRDLRRRVIRNLRPVCGGDRQLALREGLRSVQNVARYFVDLASLPRRDMSRFEAEHLEVFHAERLKALDEPGPIIIVSAHSGNAELAIQAIAARGRPFVALVEAQEPPEWSAFMLGLRTANGARFVEASNGGLRRALMALRDGEVLGMMADRDIQGTGVCAEVFGRKVLLPRGPWDLARRYQATVLPIFSGRKRRDQFRVWVGEPFVLQRTDDEAADISAAVARYAGLLERHLRRDPGQWMVLEDFWRKHRCG